MSDPFVLGVNYWPRHKAMYWWSNFDAAEVREEFGVIAGLGLKVARIFLLWDDFQPDPESVSSARLADLHTVADIAAENGLGLDITFFTGHMSGPNWAPRWLLGEPAVPLQRQLVSAGRVVEGSYRNMFSDPVALEAERLLLTTVVTELREHPAVWLWNLGNEPDLFAWPDTDAAGQEWVREMVGLIHSIDPNHPVTCGCHNDSLVRDNHLRLDQVFAETDVAVMHSYPMYSDLSRNPLDPDFVPFTCVMTSALCGKPVLMEEWGGCTVGPGEPSQVWEWPGYNRPMRQFMASEQDLADYVEAVLPRLQYTGATGAFLWCFADYIPELWDKPPCDYQRHERFFGLVRPDGSLKPHAEVMRRFAATNPQIQPAPADLVAPISGDDFYQDPVAALKERYANFSALPK